MQNCSLTQAQVQSYPETFTNMCLFITRLSLPGIIVQDLNDSIPSYYISYMSSETLQTTTPGAVIVAQLVDCCFQFQRSVVRIQSSANIYIEHLLTTVLKR